jgi:hypothetical protein
MPSASSAPNRMSNTVTWVEQGRAFVAGVPAARHLEGDPSEDRAGYREEGAEQVEEQREILHW